MQKDDVIAELEKIMADGIVTHQEYEDFLKMLDASDLAEEEKGALRDQLKEIRDQTSQAFEETAPPEEAKVETAEEPDAVKAEPKKEAPKAKTGGFDSNIIFADELDIAPEIGALALKLTGKHEVIDSYTIEGRKIQIITCPKEMAPIYCVTLPELKIPDHRAIAKFQEMVLKESRLDPVKLDPEVRNKKFTEEIKQIIKSHEPAIPDQKLDTYSEYILMNMIGYGLLDPLLADDNLEEVMLLGMDRRVYVAHRKHDMMSTNLLFHSEELAENIIQRMGRNVGRKVDTMNPLLDARLADGSRVNATIPPITPDGATLTIRKFKEDPLTFVDLIGFRTFSVDFAAWLWVVMDGMGVKPANAIVAGGTGSGKTTTLNSLATFIPETDRVLTIEDTLELQLKPHKHWIRMETKSANPEGKGAVNMDALVKNTLRMRPDRIILGEVRGSETATLFTAMNTGHDGCMGTLHANSARETITRLTSPPMSVPLIMIPAMDLILIQNRFKHPTKGTLRRITEVAEVAGMEGETVQQNRVFEYNPDTDVLEETGTPSKSIQTLATKSGRGAKEINAEIAKRAVCIKYMVDNKVKGLNNVKEIIIAFNKDPDGFVQAMS